LNYDSQGSACKRNFLRVVRVITSTDGNTLMIEHNKNVENADIHLNYDSQGSACKRNFLRVVRVITSTDGNTLNTIRMMRMLMFI
jgi:uncharacterized protein YqkB